MSHSAEQYNHIDDLNGAGETFTSLHFNIYTCELFVSYYTMICRIMQLFGEIGASQIIYFSINQTAQI